MTSCTFEVLLNTNVGTWFKACRLCEAVSATPAWSIPMSPGLKRSSGTQNRSVSIANTCQNRWENYIIWRDRNIIVTAWRGTQHNMQPPDQLNLQHGIQIVNRKANLSCTLYLLLRIRQLVVRFHVAFHHVGVVRQDKLFLQLAAYVVHRTSLCAVAT